MTPKEIISALADIAENIKANEHNLSDLARHVVTAYGLGFNAWFCLCCELADRRAQREGFKDQFTRGIAIIERNKKLFVPIIRKRA